MEGSCARRVGDTAPSPPSAELPRRGSGIARPASHRGSERRRLIHRSRPPPCGGQIREADQGVGLGLGDAKVRAVTESATDPSVAFGDSSPQGGERRSSGDAADAKINAAPNHTSPVALPHSPISIFHSPPAPKTRTPPRRGELSRGRRWWLFLFLWIESSLIRCRHSGPVPTNDRIADRGRPCSRIPKNSRRRSSLTRRFRLLGAFRSCLPRVRPPLPRRVRQG
jgi:hypothetical protein